MTDNVDQSKSTTAEALGPGSELRTEEQNVEMLETLTTETELSESEFHELEDVRSASTRSRRLVVCYGTLSGKNIIFQSVG